MPNMSVLSSICFGIAWLIMMGGVIHYILVGSKGDLNPLKGFVFILTCISVGAFFMLLGMVFA
jgi:hypothetical protein